jgi:hypothetical protein
MAVRLSALRTSRTLLPRNIIILMFLRPIGVQKSKGILVNRPRRPIGLWDVEAPTFPTISVHRWRWGCQYYTPAALYLLGRFLMLISVTGSVDPRAIVRLEGLGQLKKFSDIGESNTRPSSNYAPACRTTWGLYCMYTSHCRRIRTGSNSGQEWHKSFRWSRCQQMAGAANRYRYGRYGVFTARANEKQTLLKFFNLFRIHPHIVTNPGHYWVR